MCQDDEPSEVPKVVQAAEAAEEPKVGFDTVEEKLAQQHDTDTHKHQLHKHGTQLSGMRQDDEQSVAPKDAQAAEATGEHKALT